MKKITFLFIVLSSLMLGAQNYPNNRPQLLLGKEVRVIETDQSKNPEWGYSNFYADTIGVEGYKRTKSYSPRNTLHGRQFKVINVKDISTKSDPNKFFLTLRAIDGETISYLYRFGTPENYFPFEVIGGLDLPEGFYCDFMKKYEYSSTETYKANVGGAKHIVKKIIDGKPTYELEIIEFFPSEGNYGQGATLILENNKKIDRPTDVVLPQFHSSKEYKYMYSFQLTPKDLELLKTNRVVGVKLFDKVAKIDTGDKIREIIKCITK